ncbi:Hpt domain-containing protein [Candidatus Nitrosotenuis chungbukensis]|uniref:Hpt domain-containing protein n=1 Tax=Candidatus Nitrosotenuis chungbukensis TaxID=1353246 RepID=UPI0006936572|nr:Hpt domain-containing protein [Candidatus Nitrosotenuis chungbukensis]WKT57707.1 Hpt domain-containing protein [Candidatus Nitrosotenuis chungbukensis]
MSEEFLRVAKKEVSDDIAEIGSLLRACSGDSDISKNAAEIEKHTHKIKGLAPMMGQIEIGDVASTLDALLKLAISGNMPPDLFQSIKKSHQFMLDTIDGHESDFASLKSDLDKKYSAFLSRK